MEDGCLKWASIVLGVVSIAATIFLILTLATSNSNPYYNPYGGLNILLAWVVWVPFGLIAGFIALICWTSYLARKSGQS